MSQEIVELEKYRELLKKCIKEKEAPLKVAQTRLVTRVSRPGVEACKDSAQYKYVKLSSSSRFSSISNVLYMFIVSSYLPLSCPTSIFRLSSSMTVDSEHILYRYLLFVELFRCF